MSGCLVRNRRGSRNSSEGLVEAGNEEEETSGAGDFEMDTGVLDTISQQFESLDYFTNYSSLLLDEIRIRGYKFVIRKVLSDLDCWYFYVLST